MLEWVQFDPGLSAAICHPPKVMMLTPAFHPELCRRRIGDDPPQLMHVLEKVL